VSDCLGQSAGGVFNALLGTVTPIPLPITAPRYLGVKVGVDDEMAPVAWICRPTPRIAVRNRWLGSKSRYFPSSRVS